MTEETTKSIQIVQDTAPQEIKSIRHAKKRAFLEIFFSAEGNIKRCCRVLKMNRATYYEWYRSDEQFRLMIDLQRSELNDDMKERLLKMAKKDDLGAVIFYLKTRHPEFQTQTKSITTESNGVRFTLSRGESVE